MVDLFLNNPEYENDMLLTSAQALECAGPNTVLVVVDVNRPSLTECPELLKICKSIVVLDHHRAGTETCLGWEASERLIYDLAELNY